MSKIKEEDIENIRKAVEKEFLGVSRRPCFTTGSHREENHC